MKDGQPRKRKPFIVYYRVSTNKQGVTGLGMSAQQTAVKDYLKDKYPPKYEFKEVESGKKAHRPELTKALKLTKNQNGILLVAKLDRLSRDLHFITSLEKAKINFVCCDYPSMDRFQLHIMGSIAQWEREQISRRTKAALAEAKKKGQLLGSRHPTVQAALEKWRAQRAILRRQTEQQKKTALRRKITKQRLSKRERVGQADSSYFESPSAQRAFLCGNSARVERFGHKIPAQKALACHTNRPCSKKAGLDPARARQPLSCAGGKKL